jgi:hypothetical protein
MNETELVERFQGLRPKHGMWLFVCPLSETWLGRFDPLGIPFLPNDRPPRLVIECERTTRCGHTCLAYTSVRRGDTPASIARRLLRGRVIEK